MSHLLVLLKRAKLHTDKSILFNIVEYLHNFNDYTEEEKRLSIKLLEENALLYLTELSTSELRNTRSDYTNKCIRCGRVITSEQSIKRGLGPTCYKKFKFPNKKKQASLSKYFLIGEL